jgi:hypothetical protein
MAAKQIIVLLDSTLESLEALNFALEYFRDSEHTVKIVFSKNELSVNSRSEPINILPLIKTGNWPQNTVDESLIRHIIDQNDLQKSNFTIDEIHHDDFCLSEYCQFADLVIAQNETVKRFAQNCSNKACKGNVPVLILPNSLRKINRIILIDDGTPSSLYAIKQFCQVFDDYCMRWEVSLLDYVTRYSSKHLTQQKLIVDYLKTHCSNIAVHPFTGEQPDKLRTYLNVDQNTIVVTGSNPDAELIEKYFLNVKVATIAAVI